MSIHSFSTLATPWLQGLSITLSLTFLSLVLGFAVAVLLCCARNSTHIIVRLPTRLWVFVIRGTPLLVQIFLVYFGAAQFQALRASPLWLLFHTPFGCALIALVINSSAYTSELLLGALRAIPQGEQEACQALGLTKRQAFQYILFPRALRLVLPAYFNEAIMVQKGTSLVSTITLIDLMGVTREMIANTYAAMGYLCLAGLLYLALNGLLTLCFKKLEQHYS